MKIIKYKFVSAEINHGTEEQPNIEQILSDKEIRCSAADLEANEEIAKREAYNGVYTVEDAEDSPAVLTIEERVAALESAQPAPAEYVAGTWYYRGDKVLFNDEIYTCIAPVGVVCVWSPVEYPIYWARN